MNTKQVLIAVAVGVVLWLLSMSIWKHEENKAPEADVAQMEQQVVEGPTAIDIIHQRKSVRKYTGEQVSKEDLITLVKAGMAAPTSNNRQPWAFFIINDKEKLTELANTLPKNNEMLEMCSAAIVVCGDLNKAKVEPYEDYWMIDCAMASQNILLAAEQLGLGAVFTAAYPYPERVMPVREVLGLPDNLRPLTVIPIGYPTGEEKAKDKWKEENLYFNKFQAKNHE